MKLIYKTSIIVVCIVFFGCKKQFDKNYYKDCVGEDKVISNNATLVKPAMIDYFFLNDRSNASKIIKQGNFEPTILSDSLAEILRDVFKQKFANRLNNVGIREIVSLDTSKQMIVVCFFYELYTPVKKKLYCSNNFKITAENNRFLFFENTIKTAFVNPKEDADGFIGIAGLVVINKNFNNEKLIVNEKYFYCN